MSQNRRRMDRIAKEFLQRSPDVLTRFRKRTPEKETGKGEAKKEGGEEERREREVRTGEIAPMLLKGDGRPSASGCWHTMCRAVQPPGIDEIVCCADVFSKYDNKSRRTSALTDRVTACSMPAPNHLLVLYACTALGQIFHTSFAEY